ncbi:MAG: hypothetical protein OXI60_06385 [Acidiferrobacterales bacterium]|nr:hypothetical protein [Acidiferrobacterales bacterium]
MPVHSKLLEILRCPVTKQPLSALAEDKLARINAQIRAGQVQHSDESIVEKELDEALITENGTLVYRVDDDIPIMLQDFSIPMPEVD